MKVLHTYKRVDVPGRPEYRFAVYEMSDIRMKMAGGEYVIPREVWSTGAVNMSDKDGVRKKERQAFEEACRRNGARPRRANFQESLVFAAELRAMGGSS